MRFKVHQRIGYVWLLCKASFKLVLLIQYIFVFLCHKCLVRTMFVLTLKDLKKNVMCMHNFSYLKIDSLIHEKFQLP